MKTYRVSLFGIQWEWDDGAEVSDAPRNMQLIVRAEDPDAALEEAKLSASEMFFGLIDRVAATDVEPFDDRHKEKRS
jgi:hypothetical protein